MAGTYTHYAWELSLYSGKTRAYLRYKAIPFVERHTNLLDMRKIRRKVHASVMPVLVTPEGEWLQDTSSIIDALEARHPQAPILPTTPRQRLAACLLEAWGDEFWLASAMHYRWNFPENFEQLFRFEGGDNLLPGLPRPLKDAVVNRAAAQLRNFCPGLGVVPEQTAQIEAWTQAMCDALETHFAAQPYLLGSKPSLGDFGLIGPLYAHLGRDPYPKRVLMGPRPHLAAWVARMQQPPEPQGGEFLPDDAVPATLQPLFDSVFGEFWPQLLATQDKVAAAVPALQAGRGFSRNLGLITIPLAGADFRLQARPFSLWMAQRAYDALAAMSEADQRQARAWLDSVGGGAMSALQIQPRLQRLGLRVAPA